MACVHKRVIGILGLGSLLVGGCQQDGTGPATGGAQKRVQSSPAAPAAAMPGLQPAPMRASGFAAPAAPSAAVVLQVPWGRGPGQVGRLLPKEGAPEGPSSLDVDARGRIYLLDQVNGRVLLAERGRVMGAVPLPSVTYRDVAVVGAGVLAAVDRTVGQHVTLLSGTGPARFVDVVGPGIPEGGGITALEARRDGLWLEWAHQYGVRVADALGRRDRRRPRVWGRFAPRGRWLVRAVRAGPHGVVLLGRRRGASSPSVRIRTRLRFDAVVRQILGLAVHPDGGVTVAVHLIPGPGAAAVESERVTLVHAAPDGPEAWRLDLPPSVGGFSPLRVLRLGRDGYLYYLHLGASEVSVWRVVP